MIGRNDALSMLEKFQPQDDEDELYALSYSLAHTSKTERRKWIRNNESYQKQTISAAIEISRIWRGYWCRKLISLMEKANVQESNSLKDGAELKDEEVKGNESIVLSSSQEKSSISRHAAAVVIQRVWRKHIDTQVFRYYRDLINFRGRGDPALMLRCINPNEAKLLDAAAGAHVRFRLAGEKFPPNIYYKIYTHRPIVDMCANSPKDYTASAAKRKSALEVHNRMTFGGTGDNQAGWYERIENNGWRLVSDRLLQAAMDPVTWETSKKSVDFHHVRIERRAIVEQKRRRRKIEWMKKMYKEGMLKAREADDDTKHLVEKAARGLVNTVAVQGPEAVMDWEVDELLQWTTALNFDDYIEAWKESATSTASEVDITGKQHSNHHQSNNIAPPLPADFDPYTLTRDSSVGFHRPYRSDLAEASVSSRKADSGGKHAPPSGREWKDRSGVSLKHPVQQST